MFTQVRSTNRRVSPGEVNGRAVMKAVYVVLEPQYQNALTQAATSLNDQNGPLAIDLSGYLIEELRDPQNYADFCADVAEAARLGSCRPSIRHVALRAAAARRARRSLPVEW